MWGEQFLESRMTKRLNIFLWDAKRNKIDQKLVRGGWQWNGGTVHSRLCHFLARWQGANYITALCLVFLMGKMGIIMIKDLPSRVVSAIRWELCSTWHLPYPQYIQLWLLALAKLFLKMALRLGFAYKWFIWEVISASTGRRMQKWDRKGKKAKTGSLHK